MLNMNFEPTINPNKGDIINSFNAQDIMINLQLLMLDNNNSRLRDLQSQIKGNLALKKAIRADIEELQKFIMQGSETIGDTDCVYVPTEYYHNGLQIDKKHNYDTSTNKLTTTESRNTDKDSGYFKSYNYTTVAGNWVNFVSREAVQTKIDKYQKRMDTLDEQSQLIQVGIQTVTDGRKLTFETLTNLISRFFDASSTITKNIR